MPAEARYCAAAPEHLLRVSLDTLTAVYDRRSGQTHLLAAPLPELIDALGNQDWLLGDFATHLAAEYDLSAENGDTAATIAARLDELAALGLVEVR